MASSFPAKLAKQPTLGDRVVHSRRPAPDTRAALRESLLSLSLSTSSLTESTILRIRKLVVSLAGSADLDDIFSNAVVGGKALHLAELTQLGERVPAASVCTTHAYDAHVRALPGLEDECRNVLRSGDAAQLAAVRARITGASAADADLALAVGQFLRGVPVAVQRFAVRSSGTAEDGGANSFAGQYETCLNVPRHGILEAIKHCWASMWTDRIIAYRRAAMADGGGAAAAVALPSMAVVIQQQVQSECAGVAFSLNPVTGDQYESVVECVWGQGEGLVGGTLTPHSWVADWREPVHVVRGGNAVEQTRKFALFEEPEYVRVVDTSPHERTHAPLTVAQVCDITRMATRIAGVYGQPYDIEWAREGNDIFLLQARPITSFSPSCAQGEWSYAGFDESCVLQLSMSAHAYAAMMAHAMPEVTDLSRTFYAHAFINAPLWRSFQKALRKQRQGKAPTDVVPPVHLGISTGVVRRVGCFQL